jgi:hypothetical protein
MTISTRAIGSSAAVLFLSHAALGLPSARLVYHLGPGADGCPDEKALRSEVAVRLGYDPFSSASDRTISLSITRDDNELRARAEWVESSGETRGLREMAMPLQRCDELARAMALSISIAIDPERERTGPLAPASSSAVVPATGEPVLSATSVPASALSGGGAASPTRVDASGSLRWEAGVGAFASAGTGPTPRFGGMASAALRVGRFSFGVEPRAEIPSDAPNGRFAASLAELRVVPCIHLPNAVHTCVVASPGILSAWGLGNPLASTDSTAIFGLGGRLGFELQLSGLLALRIQGDLVFHLVPVQVTWLGTELWRDRFRASVSLNPQLVVHFP